MSLSRRYPDSLLPSLAIALVGALAACDSGPDGGPTGEPTSQTVAQADPAPPANTDRAQPRHMLWRLSGQTNYVYLLGSVHLLREQDYPLGDVYDQAYEDAEQLVMELDLDDLNPVRIQQLMTAAGLSKSGLREHLGEDYWGTAAAAADDIGISLELFAPLEPWLAALTIIQLKMQQLGFDATHGVEAHFAARASLDGKPITGLETVQQQVQFFDGLPIEVQRPFLIKTLEDAAEIETEIDEMISAWKLGDTASLAENLVSSFGSFPSLYQSLVVERNKNWIADINDLLDEKDDYLVIVGALHLIGPDSVVELLRQRGLTVERL